MEASARRSVPDAAMAALTAAAPAAPPQAAARPHRARRLMARCVPAALAAAGGLLLALAFPGPGIWPAAPAGVALITIALWRRPPHAHRSLARALAAAAALGLLAGLVFFVVLLYWLHVIGPDAWLILTLVEAAYFAPMGAGIAAVARIRAAPVWAALLWVSQETIRARFPFGGFTWGRLAFSQSDSPLTRYASLGGAPLVTFLTALAGAMIAVLVTGGPAAAGPRRRREAALSRREAARSGQPALSGKAMPRLTAAVTVLAITLLGPAIPLPRVDGRPVTVAVIQGNVPRLGLGFLGQRATVLHNHVEAVHELAAMVRAGRLAQPDTVILPENSSDIDPYRDAGAYALVDAAVRDIGAPTLVGALTFTADGQHVQNRGIVWSPRTGPGAYYVKRHPVPFGEYIPMRSLLTKFIKRFQLVPYDQVAGKRPGVLRLGSVTIGDVICFEVAYDGIVRDAVNGGGQAIVVQTNNADYGRTDEPAQQLAISRLRAVEHARPVLIAATSGISAIIAPDGRVLARSRQFTRAILERQVRPATGITLADRLGELPEWVLAGAGICAAIAGILGLAIGDRLRRRREV